MSRQPSNSAKGNKDETTPARTPESRTLSRPSSQSQLGAGSAVVGSPSSSSVTSSSLAIPQIPARHSSTDSTHSPRTNSPFLHPSSTARSSSSGQHLQPQSTGDSTQSSGTSTPMSDAQKAEIVRRHLLSAEDQSRVAAAEAAAAAASSTSVSSSSAASVMSESSNKTAGPPTGTGTGLALDEQYPTPYHLEGGDVVAGVYKWVADSTAAADDSLGGGTGGGLGTSLRRSKSMVSIGADAGGSASRRQSINPGTDRPDLSGITSSTIGPSTEFEDDDNGSAMGVKAILEPGGFRRDFIVRKMVAQQAGAGNGTGDDSSSQLSVPGPMPPIGRFKTRSFIDFLSLYGHFGGEDLEEIEEGDEEDEDEEDQLEYDGGVGGTEQIPPYQGARGRGLPPSTKRSSSSRDIGSADVNERTPLVRGRSSLQRSESTRSARRRGASNDGGSKGDATVTQAVLMLLKSFVGTGVLFLGKAFHNGGILFSTIVLSFIAMISLYSFLLLVKTRLVCHGSFGDIGGILYGKYMRLAILFSIVLSQVGFVAAYTIFVAENLQAFIMAVSNCNTYVSILTLIIIQLVIFMPFAMIRNIQKLSGTALVADAFILFGLVYIFSNEIKVLADNGIADVQLFNRKDFPLLIGTAVFSFEGIGLVIPITESMKEPHRFPRVLTGVMVGVMVLFAGGGALAYAAYGSKIQTVVFVNLPQEDRFVNAAQFLYSVAILLSTPLQLFPAVRIMENGIFSRSGKHSTKVKWQKNMFRMLVVVVCSTIAWVGASDLDKFVSLIGSLACVPLCFCYPALLHYKACAHTRKQKVADIALFIFGLFAMVYTTFNTIVMLTQGGGGAPPSMGKCPPRH